MNLLLAMILFLAQSVSFPGPGLVHSVAAAPPARVTNQFCSATATAGGNPGAVSCSLPGTPTVGNHIIAACGYDGNSTTSVVSDNQSNSYVNDGKTYNAGSTVGVSVNSGKITTASGTFTVTCTNNNFTAYITVIAQEYSGLATSSWADQTANANGTTTGTHSSGSTATTSQASELLIGGIFMASCATCILTAGSGYNFVATLVTTAGSRIKTGLQDQVVSSTGTYASTFTDNQGFAAWGSVIVTYKGQ